MAGPSPAPHTADVRPRKDGGGFLVAVGVLGLLLSVGMTVELVHAGVAGPTGTVDPFASVQATPAVTTRSPQAAATPSSEEPAREASLQGGASPTPGDAGNKDLGPTTAVGPTPVESPRPKPTPTPGPASGTTPVFAGPRQP
jgi:hypothetical protein